MISPTTELSFVPTERHFASLGQGTVGLRSLAGAINFQMQVGGFLVVPVVEAEAAAEIRRFPNGSAQVTCSAGSVAVVALEETESVFLQPGQTAGISAEGKLIAALPSGTTPSRRNPEARHSKKRTGLIVLGVAGGGAAGAIAGLASRRSPASPSGP
jgi:ferric-dicitrate binding protein FerR (iron transport regulator)